MPFGNKETAEKKMPFFTGKISFTGKITEKEGINYIALWPTDDFKAYMEKLAKG